MGLLLRWLNKEEAEQLQMAGMLGASQGRSGKEFWMIRNGINGALFVVQSIAETEKMEEKSGVLPQVCVMTTDC